MPYEEVERLVRKEKLEEKYEVGAELGRGKFAIVKRVTEKESGQQYAAKFLRKRRGGKACRDDIMVEVDIMRQSMNHHRIIKVLEVFETTREMIIIIELATGGELFRMIAVDPLPEDKARSVVLQLLEGVEHLHMLNIVHLDLKPENILLYRKGQLDIRIADFGLALQIAPGEQVKTLVGTAEYVAPEILNYEPLTIAADMWSIGALTYALLTGYSPFQGETHSHTFCNVSMCDYDFEDEVFDDVSQEAKDFIEGLLQTKPSDRLTATKCLNHPWIKNHSILPNQGLNSSTSSLDSALCMDSNNSSLDPSPSSSASSSFAPRPTGRSEDDEQQEDLKKQLTEKVSKLCISTEMQKDIGALRGNLVGSASSISSSDSNTTVKVDEEDGEGGDCTNTRESDTPLVSHLETTTPPQTPSSPLLEANSSNRSKRSPSAGGIEEEGKSMSRPGSSLRVTTPIDDLISLAPDTMEKMKKLEMLKRKREEGEMVTSKREPLVRKYSGEPNNPISPRNSERRISSPATFKNHRMASTAQKLEAPVEEEESTKSKTDTPKSKDSTLSDNKQQSSNKEIFKTTSTPSLRPSKEVSSSTLNKEDTTKKSDEKSSPSLSATPKKEHVTWKENTWSKEETKKIQTSPMTSKDKPTTSENKSAVNTLSNSGISKPPPLILSSNQVEISPQIMKSKSESPLSPSKKMIVVPRASKSASPMSIEDVKRRTRGPPSNNRASWRKTPHIDPDVIDAILRGEIDDIDNNSEKKLETMVEVSEPRSSSPLAGKTCHNGDLSPSLEDEDTSSHLKKSALSDSRLDRVTKSESPRRVVMVVTSSAGRSGSVELGGGSSPRTLPRYLTSPLKSPGTVSQTDVQTIEKKQLSLTLQSSLSLSRSTPDLSSILGGSGSAKHSKRSKPNEDSYVLDSSTRKNSVSRGSTLRSNLLSGSNIVRSFTSSSPRSSPKRSPAHSKDRFKLK